jgi:hypothetical protein
MLDFLNDRIQEIQNKVVWNELNYVKGISLKSCINKYSISGDTATRMSNVKKFFKGSALGKLSYMSLDSYLTLLENYGTATGEPKVYVPITESDFYVYPTPVADLETSAYFQKKVVTLTSGGTIPFDEDVILALKYAVLADCLRDRSDDDANSYEAKFNMQLKRAIGNRISYDRNTSVIKKG